MRRKMEFLNEFWLKLIGLLTMTIDHVGYFMLLYAGQDNPMHHVAMVFRIIGRIAFPLFIFMLAEGLHKTHDRGNYLLRLAIFWGAIFGVEIIISMINLEEFSIRAFSSQAFTDLLAYGLFVFFLEKKGWWKLFSLLPLAFILLSYVAQVSEIYADATGAYNPIWTTYFPEWAGSGYSLFGFLMFLGMYYAIPLAKKIIKATFGTIVDENGQEHLLEDNEIQAHPKYQGLVNVIAITSIVLVTVLFWAIGYFAPQIDPYFTIAPQSYCVLACLFILLYNGERGYRRKWFQYFSYLYYPLHIVLIALIFMLAF